MAHPKHISHSSSHTCCTACLQISAQHVSNTDVHQTQATDFCQTNPHKSSTCCTRPQSALKCIGLTWSCSLVTHRHKEVFTASLCYLEMYACILFFPANICITLTITALSSLATSLSAFTAVQATSLSLFLSLSHFCLSLANRHCSYCCNCSYQHYSQVLPPSSPSQPSLPLYLIFHALHVLSWELSSSI